ncbi:MAG: zinc ABC transporter substrate-binding protein [Planctomycetota bacterium]|nr:zinc ABC transporter substrate-binding protein [Planctomycetota bacterium]
MQQSARWPWFLSTCFALTCLLAVTGCSGTTTEARSAAQQAAGDRLTVVCTTTMIADLARNLVGDLADVRGIMKEGEDPHVYDVRPRDAEMIASGDVILLNGYHLEATLGHIIENNAEGKVVALAERAVSEPLSGADGLGAPDPHCWMNVEYFRGYAQHARDGLMAADPAHADVYQKNAETYFAELDKLHEWVQQQVATVPHERRVMITSHDAFEYLGHAYDIEVHGMIGISTEQAPRPQDIEKLEAVIRQRGVRALFVETSVSQTLNNLIKKSAEATGVKIGGTLYSDSLGPDGTPEGTYLGMMRHNVQTIVAALK